jgi:hypothetical protein
MSGLKWEPVGALDTNPQQALRDYTANTANFGKVMAALAKSIAQSAAAPTL